jgi:transposase
MAYRYGNRPQQLLLPPSIEDYVPADAPVRVYDAFVEGLDFDELGIELDAGKVGNSSYDPKAMLKLLVYGYSYGVRISRKLERERHYNPSFIWLTGGLKPDHKTIAEFRRKHKKALCKVLKQCVRLCLKLDLIEGNALFVDGSKVRANASRDQHWSEDRCLKRLEKIDRRIEEILAECDRRDDQESADGSLVKMREELTDQQTLRSKVEGILKQLPARPGPDGQSSEKDLANLCLRLAISLALTESAGLSRSFIILDEVFSSQDSERKELIVKALANLKNHFPQIFLITHIKDIRDQVQKLIEVFSTGAGWSEVRVNGSTV